MLAVAGNETTRNAIAHGMLAFLDHPDQWELFKASRPDTAADEIVRWATPITVFQRTTTRDTVLGGQEIKAGQRVGLFYRSANFDEDVFDHPERFDVLRSPNPHLGYGGLGTHYCLGANLAKLEIQLIFNAIADAMPDIAKAGRPGPPALRLDQRHQAPAGQLHRLTSPGSDRDQDPVRICFRIGSPAAVGRIRRRLRAWPAAAVTRLRAGLARHRHEAAHAQGAHDEPDEREDHAHDRVHAGA